MSKKYELTETSITVYGIQLFQIKSLKAFGNVREGELGGYVQKEENLSQNGNAWVSGNAVLIDYKNYTKGWFIGGDETAQITNITEQTGTDYWEAQYVLGDYEITDIEPEKQEEKADDLDIIELNGKKYKRID